MSSRAERLSERVERIQQDRLRSVLARLRRGAVDSDWLAPARQLLSPSGTAEAEEALAERTWSREEQAAFLRQRQELAFHVELAAAEPRLAELVREPMALPFGREALPELVRGLWSDGSFEGRAQRAGALGTAADELAPHLWELRSRAHAAVEDAARALPLPAAGREGSPRASLPPVAPEPQAPAVRTPVELARELLARTDDAARELTRWLVRPAAVSGTIPWHVVLRALRAPELDGLARPARRLARIAAGLRGLGFERDLNTRVRAESGRAYVDPRPRVLPFAVPGDVRIVESALDFGVLADVFAARAVGCAVGLALASPALPALVRRIQAPGVEAALGGAYMQLRADRQYMCRIEGLDPAWADRLARHAGVIVLLDVRVQAALVVAGEVEARGMQDRLQQLSAAAGAALGVELPAGLAVWMGWSARDGAGELEASLAGLAAHVGLRDRFDSDWFRNPRVSEVLRGAAARGSALALPELLRELGCDAGAGIGRALELVE